MIEDDRQGRADNTYRIWALLTLEVWHQIFMEGNEAVKQVSQSMKDGRIEVLDVPVPALRPQGALVRTAWSLISAGTERAKVDLGQKSLLAKARSRPDQVKQVMDKVRSEGVLRTYRTVKARLEEQSPIGYSSAGVVDAARRAGVGASRSATASPAAAASTRTTPSSPTSRRRCARACPTASAWTRPRSRPSAPSRCRACARAASRSATASPSSASGWSARSPCSCCAPRAARSPAPTSTAAAARPSRPSAPSPRRRRPGRSPPRNCWRRPAASASTPSSSPPAPRATSPSSSPARSPATAAPWSWSATWACSVPRAPFYEKELTLKLSRSYGPGRYDPLYEEMAVDYPLGYVRWTEQRNMAEFLRLVAEGRVDVKPLITHRFAVDDAAQAYATVTDPASGSLGVLLEYPQSEPERPRIEVGRPAAGEPAPGAVGVGFLGAGNFATATLLPALAADARFAPRGVFTPSGLSARTSPRAAASRSAPGRRTKS